MLIFLNWFVTACNLCLPQSLLLVENTSTSAVSLCVCFLKWNFHGSVCRLSVCQCAEREIRCIQKISSRVRRGVLFFVVSETNTKLANFNEGKKKQKSKQSGSLFLHKAQLVEVACAGLCVLIFRSFYFPLCLCVYSSRVVSLYCICST